MKNDKLVNVLLETLINNVYWRNFVIGKLVKILRERFILNFASKAGLLD